MKDIYMIANAHLDPVWQWTWEEGAAEAVSTFRAAANLCEKHDVFMFNHNESILYQWIEEYEPDLFKRIKKLVHDGKWHIMGGWFLQPDCNIPAGESLVRQILTGNKYFFEKFGVKPATAINFDPFGHSRGLVQILAKSGYDSYVFCRPDPSTLDVPDEFQWLGFDGSRILAHRSRSFYNSEPNDAAGKIEWVTRDLPDVNLILWGVGNHGGGASRVDLQNLDALASKLAEKGINLRHASMKDYMQTRLSDIDNLPIFDKPLWHSCTGCYTTHIRIKQKHRKLENDFLLTEKMTSHSAMTGRMEYPKKELDEALYDMLFAEFHDALPGTSIQSAEEEILRTLDHGLEILSRLRMKALMVLSSGIQPSDSGDVTFMAYNPHPYPVTGIWRAEASPYRPLWEKGFRNPVLYMDGQKIPCQYEKPDINGMSYDWRKGFSFHATLKASSVNRIVCKFEIIPNAPQIQLKEQDGLYQIKTGELEVIINAATGLIDKYAVNGENYLKPGAFMPLVMEDSHDSWNIDNFASYRNIAGKFVLADSETCAKLSGTMTDSLPGVHIVEDGEVRTVAEAVFTYGHSVLCQRYIIPKRGTELKIETRVYWNEQRKMLKLSLPSKLIAPNYLGQTAYGTETWQSDGRETISHKWAAVHDGSRSKALTVINDGNGAADVLDGELRITLLRSPGYCSSFSIDPEKYPQMPPDRFNPYTEQGERFFSIRINAGSYKDRIQSIEREAQLAAEAPVFVPFTPPGSGTTVLQMITLSNPGIELTALKRAEISDEYVLRIFEPEGKPQTTEIELPSLGIKHKESLSPFEIVTLITDNNSKKLKRTDLLEDMIKL